MHYFVQPIGHSAHFPIRFVVYVGSHSGHFIAVELLTGRLLWTTQFEEETPPTGKDGDEDDRKRRKRRRVEATASCSSDGDRIFVGEFVN